MGVSTVVSSGSLGNVKGATGPGHQGGHLVYAKNQARWWFFTWTGVFDSGTATSGSTSQLVDTGKSWTADSLLGYGCVITGGTGAGQWFSIGRNTSNTLPVVDNGATGSWLATALASGSTYTIVDAVHIHAYVSSTSDLSTSTWSEATGSPSPTINTGALDLGWGINVAGGKNNPGGYGEFPTDGRNLVVGYADVGGVDVVYLQLQIDTHYQHMTERARITGASTITWDTSGGGGSIWAQRGLPGIECAPEFPQALAIAYHSGTGRWWVSSEQNFESICGYASNGADSGLANWDPAWQSNNAGVKPTGWDNLTGAPWQSAIAPISSGFVLSVYEDGSYDGTQIAGATHLAGLKYAESASNAQWVGNHATGAAIPSLLTASNHPNDWGIVARTTTDVHVVRRNSATVLEQIRYSGHSGSWGSKVTLPTTGLTGQQSGGGVPLVSDGTSVWCFCIDTDANHSIRYLKWTVAGGWDASWSTVSTDSTVKDFLVAFMGNNLIGVAWTVGASTPFAVAASSLSLSAVTPTAGTSAQRGWGFS